MCLEVVFTHNTSFHSLFHILIIIHTYNDETQDMVRVQVMNQYAIIYAVNTRCRQVRQDNKSIPLIFE